MDSMIKGTKLVKLWLPSFWPRGCGRAGPISGQNDIFPVPLGLIIPEGWRHKNDLTEDQESQTQNSIFHTHYDDRNLCSLSQAFHNLRFLFNFNFQEEKKEEKNVLFFWSECNYVTIVQERERFEVT